ncbi:hypothetical protein C8F01DRAFT_1295683 [Mycena amicta]|nr:hypothetical protein C8F01DRAFT_1295683 [Mycena amicta]
MWVRAVGQLRIKGRHSFVLLNTMASTQPVKYKPCDSCANTGNSSTCDKDPIGPGDGCLLCAIRGIPCRLVPVHREANLGMSPHYWQPQSYQEAHYPALNTAPQGGMYGSAYPMPAPPIPEQPRYGQPYHAAGSSWYADQLRNGPDAPLAPLPPHNASVSALFPSLPCKRCANESIKLEDYCKYSITQEGQMVCSNCRKAKVRCKPRYGSGYE